MTIFFKVHFKYDYETFAILIYCSIHYRIQMKNRQNLSSPLWEKTIFQACKLSKNIFSEQDPNTIDYYQQEKSICHSIQEKSLTKSEQKLKVKKKQVIGTLEKNEQSFSSLEYDENIFEQEIKQESQKTDKIIKNVINDEQFRQGSEGEDDMLDLWNQIQQKSQPQQQNPMQSRQKLKDQQSSMELSEGEMQKWLEECNKTSKQQQNKGVIMIDDASSNSNKTLKNSEEGASWASLNQLLNEAMQQDSQKDQTEENEEGDIAEVERDIKKCNLLACESIFNNNKMAEFVIDDQSPRLFASKESFSGSQSSKNSQTQKFAPCKIDTEYYRIYQNPQFMTIMNPQFVMGQTLCKRINWEIAEQIYANQHLPKSKHFLKTQLIIYGKDFMIHDLSKFVKSSLKEGYHMYFGMQSLGFNYIFDKKNDEKQSKSADVSLLSEQPIDYLFFPYNGQVLLETEYPDLLQDPKADIKTINLYLSLTKEKVAVIDRKTFTKSRDRRQVLQIRNYDEFERKPSDYLGIIESKIGKFSNQWFCETIIYVPKKKTFCKKICQKNWNKLKMQLILSQTGSIVAELGIIDAQSSVTNCILFGDNKSSHAMVGTFEENSQFMNYVIRISSLSPLIGFAMAISRKIFVNSN